MGPVSYTHLDVYKRQSLPYDHVFDQGWRFGLKFRLVTPTPCANPV